MQPDQMTNFFTRSDGTYAFARWGRPIVPVVFGVDGPTLGVVKGAIEAVVALAGHKMAETDPELGANLMVFFFRDWAELKDLPNLDQLIPDLGPLVDRFGVRWPITLGFLALIGVLVALAQATDYFAIMALSGALGFFVLGCNYAVYGAAASYYAAEMRGRGSGAAIAWGRLGSVAGPLIGGYLLQGGSAPSEVVYAMAPFALVAAVGTFALTFVPRSS